MGLRENALKAISGKDTSLVAGVLRTGLQVATPLYALGNAARSVGFAVGVKRRYPLGRPTVSIGNLTTGGTGKTPMVGYVARRLIQAGHRPCILLRGYRGGDEAQEHKLLLGDEVQVEPNPDRVLAAQVALGEDPSITCFVLDDGFQHRRAKRDLDLVLIDATNPWGFGHMLPRGLMREPKSALRRADAVIVTRCDQTDANALAELDRQIKALTGKPPIAHAEHGWTGLREADAIEHELAAIKDKTVMGVVGIGNPDAFTRTLEQYAGQVVHCEQKPDHHRYTRTELLGLIDLAQTAGAQAMVTTEKDWVKWSLLLEDDTLEMPIYRAALSMRLCDGEQALNQLLNKRIPSTE